MAGHLLDAGYRLVVFNRTPSRADGLVARGATWAETPGRGRLGRRHRHHHGRLPCRRRRRLLRVGRHHRERSGRTLSSIDMTTSSPALATTGRLGRGGPRDRRARRTGLRRRHRCAQRDAHDHGRRRPGGVRSGRAAPAGDGHQRRSAGRPRCRAAHQDGEPGRHRRLDAGDRGVARLCGGRRARHETRAAVDRRGLGSVVVARESGASHPRRRLLGRLLREALRQGHADRAGVSRRDGPHAAGPDGGQTALRHPGDRRRVGSWHAGALASLRRRGGAGPRGRRSPPRASPRAGA